MDRIADKCILLCFGVLLLLGREQAEHAVTALLMAVTAAALSLYIEETKSFFILYAGIFAAAVWNPKILLFFPVFFYDMVYNRNYYPALPLLPLFFLNMPKDMEKTALWLFTGALSAALAFKTLKNQHLLDEQIRIRDDGAERNLALKEKNKYLLEKQDYEIHLATLRERKRIAREIHDNVGHMLSRSILLLGALLTSEKEGTVHEQLWHMKDTLNQAMDSIRKSVHDLHDEAVDLRQAVEEIIGPIKQDYAVIFEYDMSGHIPKRVKYCLIAVAKEAVSNILKHSSGNRVQISFREHPGFYRLLIEDNGMGADIKKGQGIGLQNMKERADALGGTFHISTKTGFGIFMTIPKTEEILCGS